MDKKARPSNVLPARDPRRSTGADGSRGGKALSWKWELKKRGSSNYTRTLKMKAVPQDRGSATLLLGLSEETQSNIQRDVCAPVVTGVHSSQGTHTTRVPSSSRVVLGHRKGCNLAICDSKEGPRGYCVE